MKQEKSATVTLVKNDYRQYQGNQDVMHVHFIAFDNGDEGEYHTAKISCQDFQQGQYCNYTIEQKGFRSGKPEMRIWPSRINSNQGRSNSIGSTGSGFSNNKSSGKPGRNENAIIAQHAISKSVELIACGQIKLDELFTKAQEIFDWTSSK